MSPVLPASGATVCHSSSVMNGMNGCARRSVASSSRTSTERVPRAAACVAARIGRASCTLASSTYQSQYSSHTNSYSAFAARSKRYCVDVGRDVVLGLLQAAEEPAVDERQRLRLRLVEAAILALDVHQHEARRVPQLVAEVAVAVAAVEVEVERAVERRERREREAHRIGAERRNAVRETACACAARPSRPAADPSCCWCVLATSVSSVDAVDEVDRDRARCPSTSTSCCLPRRARSH